MKKVGIIDYDCGNLFSVEHAFEKINTKPYFCKTPEAVLQADRLLLPGVGAFGSAISTISKNGIKDAILAVAQKGRPIMGICLGMQLLVDTSEELGEHTGLGLIPGHIGPLPQIAHGASRRYKTPNVGWSKLNSTEENVWNGSILTRTKVSEYAYFVHSFHLTNGHPEFVLATQTFGDIESPAVISRDNISGCQFHPERSGEVGLNILRSWMER